MPLAFFKWRIGLIVLPEVQRRREASSDIKQGKFDLLQWVIESAERDPDPRAKSPYNILGRMVLYNIFAQHTTQATAATILFDLISYPSGQQVQDELGQEAESMLSRAIDDPYCTREAKKLDSVIRESMRLNPMFGRGVVKEVVQLGGVTTPEGLHLPQHCHVSTASTSCVQRDAKVYENGDQFVPLRFYRLPRGQAGLRDKRLCATSVGDNFMTFGLGRHACPGRFFAVQLLKLLLGFILINYEFENLQERPEFLTFGDLTMPSPTKVKIRCRTKPVQA